MGRIYFNAVLGGLGGLLGWAGIVLCGRIVADAPPLLASGLLGLVLGAMLGGTLGCADGLIESRSLRRGLRGAGFGLLLGAIGGAAGGIVGEWLFALAGRQGVWPRALGWAVLGLLVGAADGIAHRMPSRIRYGTLGGLIGGLIGGSTYQWLMLRVPGRHPSAEAWSGALGLVLLGLCIGLMTGLVETLLRTAWVKFLNGRFEGQSRTIDPARAVTTLGRSDGSNIILRGDGTVADLHAEIALVNGEYVLRPRNGIVSVERAGPVPPASSCVLRPGDRIHLGGLRLVFFAEEHAR